MRRTVGNPSAVILSSRAASSRRGHSPLLNGFMKSRAIPMHNFLLQYFPAYRARMFPPVAPCKWNMRSRFAHVYTRMYICICMVYTYVGACPDAIERVETSRNERTNGRGKIVDSMGGEGRGEGGGVMTLVRQSEYRNSFIIGILYGRLNNLKAFCLYRDCSNRYLHDSRTETFYA